MYRTLFFIIAAIHLIGLVTGEVNLFYYTKPLLMPALALWLFRSTESHRPLLVMAWLVGLFFSTLGDIFLMGQGSSSFLLGLGSFLLAHISYIAGIARGVKTEAGFLKRKPIWVLPFLVYPVGLLWFLWPGIPAGMGLPVLVYALVISTMAMTMANLYSHIPRTAFQLLMLGAVLFVLSDSLIAVNKFAVPIPGERVLIMLTYIVGQYLLAKGVVALRRSE